MGTPGCGEELRRDAFPGNQLCAFLGFWGGAMLCDGSFYVLA